MEKYKRNCDEKGVILYLCSATEQNRFNELYEKKKIVGPCPAQNFNYTIIEGLGKNEKICVISALPVINENINSFCIKKDNVTYYGLNNRKGIFRRVSNIINFIRTSQLIADNEKVKAILCDATCVSANVVANFIARKLQCPCIAIITDIPTIMNENKVSFVDRISEYFMKRYSAYIFLTEAMNAYLNSSQKKSYIVMEGLFDFTYEEQKTVKKSSKNICLYSGAIWKNSGFEELINGFIMADIPNAELHIYGDGDGKENVIKLCEKDEKTKYLGCVSLREIREKQREATLLVNPRKSVGKYTKYSFPSKTMEYMASGTPVLMTHLPGVPDEYYEYLYELKDETVEGFAKAFKEIFSLDREIINKKGIDAKKYIYENKNSTKQTKIMYDFILKIIDGES